MKALLQDLLCWLIGHRPSLRNAPGQIALADGRVVAYTKTEFVCARCGVPL